VTNVDVTAVELTDPPRPLPLKMERDDSELLMLLSVAAHPSATAADAVATGHIVTATDTIDADNEVGFDLRYLTETGFGIHLVTRGIIECNIRNGFSLWQFRW